MRITRPRTLLLKLSLAFTLTIAGLPAAAFSQTAAGWETLRPDGADFTVLMPNGSTDESSDHLYQRRILKTRLFLSTSKSGPVLAVVTMTGIKANPAYSEMQRLNSYVDAFKSWFPPKVRGEDAIGKITLAGAKTLNGNAGREYRVMIADLNGTAQVFLTRKRFYAIVVLLTKKDDALPEKFLGSFELPEKSAEVPATVAAKSEDPEPAGQPDPSASPAKPADQPKADADAGDAKKPVEATGGAEAQPPKRAPISAGVLNGKALSLPKPIYPPDAISAGVSGVVVVQVTIDESGSVSAAHAVSGPPLLQAAAVAAARQAKFSQTFLVGEPVRVTGVLLYNFGAPTSGTDFSL